MTKKTLKQEVGDKFIIENGNIVINKGKMTNTAVGGNIQIIQSRDELVAELQDLIRSIRIDADDSKDKNKSIRELEVINQEIEKVTTGNENEKKDAKAGLKKSAEDLKNGISNTAKMTKDISTLSEKLPELGGKLSSLLDSLPF